MISCTVALCAEKVLVDARSNSVSIVGLLEEIAFQGQLVLVPALSCLFLLTRDESDSDECDLRVVVKLNNEILFQAPVHANFQGKRVNRLVADIAGVPVTAPGALMFEIVHDSTVLGAWEIKVQQSTPISPTISVARPDSTAQ